MAAPSPLVARLSIAGAAVLWSTGGAAIKLAELEAAPVAGGRALVSAIVLAALLPSARGRWTGPVLLAGAAYAATNILFVYANTRTTAGAAIFLQNIAPIWVMLLGPWLLGERPTRPELWSVPVSLLGSALFFGGDLGEGAAAGNGAALGASVSYALLIIAYRRLSGPEGLTATVAGAVMVVAACAPMATASPWPSPTGWAAIAYLGAVQQGLGAVLFLHGIRGVSALEAALLVLLEPLLSPVFAFFTVGEKLSGWALLGGGLLLFAAAFRTIAARAGPPKIRPKRDAP